MKVPKKWLYGVAACLLIIFIWYFTGVEITYGEDTVDYDPFIKKEPSFTFLFANTAMCGECDLRPLELIPYEGRTKLLEYCRARLGIDSINACYNQLKVMYPSVIIK